MSLGNSKIMQMAGGAMKGFSVGGPYGAAIGAVGSLHPNSTLGQAVDMVGSAKSMGKFGGGSSEGVGLATEPDSLQDQNYLGDYSFQGQPQSQNYLGDYSFQQPSYGMPAMGRMMQTKYGAR